jgi:hypothetical protein
MVGTVYDARSDSPQSFRYASLSSGLEIIRKTSGGQQIAIAQTTDIDRANGMVNLTTVLLVRASVEQHLFGRSPIRNSRSRELAHLYCGHLGTPNGRLWPDRQNLSHAVREFEAESVSYLVCARLGIDTASDEYLAAYVGRCSATPPVSLDRVMKSVWLLEQMGRSRLGLRK